MSLSELVITDKELIINKKKVKIQGLTLETLGIIIKDDIDFLETFFNNITNVASVISESPALAAKLIGHCVLEDIQDEEIKKLPIGVQVIILKEIWDMSMLGEERVVSLIMNLSKSHKG